MIFTSYRNGNSIINYRNGNVNIYFDNLAGFIPNHYRYGKIINKKNGDRMGTSFPERLKQLREEKEWTQEYLGKLLGFSDATINRYEKGLRSPEPETLSKLADIFNTTTDYLLGRTDDRYGYRVAEKPEKYITEIQAAHRTDDPMDELPEEARRSLEEFKQYILQKYGKKN